MCLEAVVQVIKYYIAIGADEMLMRYGIRAHCFKNGKLVRIGLHYFNNMADVDKLIDFLKIIDNKNP